MWGCIDEKEEKKKKKKKKKEASEGRTTSVARQVTLAFKWGRDAWIGILTCVSFYSSNHITRFDDE